MPVMPFEKFEYIIKHLQEYESKRNRISDFIEKELCSDSYCLFNVGEDLSTIITSMLADEFNCWYNIRFNKVLEVSENDSESFEILQKAIGINGCLKEESSTSMWWNKKYNRWDNDIEYWLYEDNKRITINDGKTTPSVAISPPSQPIS